MSVRPTASMPTRISSAADPNVPHYGILMGGEKIMKVEGYGEAFTGFSSIPRRELAEFVRLAVGRSVESPQALEEGSNMGINWDKNPDRIVFKSPGACAADVLVTHGVKGFIIPRTLIGKPSVEANALFESVMPSGTTLEDVIKSLSSVSYPESTEMESLRSELLDGANISSGYIQQYLQASKNEVGNSAKTGLGKKGFTDLDEDYFREMGQPLPEEVPALATLAMGKEIANQLKGGNSNDETLKALIAQNQLLIEQLASRQAPAETLTEPAPKKAVGTKKDTN